MQHSIAALTLCFALPFTAGCGTEETHDPQDGHTHADGTTHGQEQGKNDHSMELEEKGAVDLGTAVVGDATFALDATGPATAGEVVTLNVRLTDGSMPDTIRLWYGRESGVGSMKSKGDAHGDHFHADVEIPGEDIENAALWLEVVSSEGSKATQSVSY